MAYEAARSAPCTVKAESDGRGRVARGRPVGPCQTAFAGEERDPGTTAMPPTEPRPQCRCPLDR
jgi:hypothetical protein